VCALAHALRITRSCEDAINADLGCRIRTQADRAEAGVRNFLRACGNDSAMTPTGLIRHLKHNDCIKDTFIEKKRKQKGKKKKTRERGGQ